MRRHGALDPHGVARLEEHLRGCEECRALSQLGDALDGAMGHQQEASLAAVDWDGLHTKLMERLGRRRREVGKALVLVPFGLLGFLLQPPSADEMPAALASVALCVVVGWWVWRRLRDWETRTEKAAHSTQELLALAREQNNRLVTALRRMIKVAGVTVVVLPWGLLLPFVHGLDCFPFIFLPAVMLLVGVAVQGWLLPQALAERAELS